jgi:hypothetical protein
MENFDDPLDTGSVPAAESGLQVTDELRTIWQQTAFWALIFAIILVVFFGYSTLQLLYTTLVTENQAAGIFAWITSTAVYAAFYLFPALLFYRFANQLKASLESDNGWQLNESFLNFKRFYRYIGILSIVLIGLLLLMLLFLSIALSNYPSH